MGRAATDDRALIEAVRTGNLHAFGTLYERHVGAVRGLARRLCGNHSDADDVVGDVFTNTLRAIKSGRGPQDDLRPYVLTATRHTVIKMRTRRDSGRAIPTTDEQLDVPVCDESLAPEGDSDTIGAAFVQLPDRFRNVLWLSCVEDLPPAEVGRHTDLSPGAVSSLTLRARRALARSYLLSRITQPVVSAECVTTRELLPSVVRNEASVGTVTRVDRHLASCCECSDAAAEMRALAGSLRSYPWFAAAVAWLRSLGGSATGGLAPVVVTAVAVLTFTAADAPIPAAQRPAIPATPTLAAPPAREPHHATGPTTASHHSTAWRPTSVEMPAADPPAQHAEPTTMLREGGVPSSAVPVIDGIVDALVDDAVATPVPPIVPVSGSVDAVEEVVSTTLGTVDQLGQQVASTSESLTGVTGQLLETVDQTVVDLLDAAGAGQLAATVEPVLDGATAAVTTGVVEPLTGLVADTTAGTTTLVTESATTLLGPGPLH